MITKDGYLSYLTSVVTHMLPDVSIQNTTRESLPTGPTPSLPSDWRAAAGVRRYVVSSTVGISSGTKQTSLRVPQNSQTQTYILCCNYIHYSSTHSHTLTYFVIIIFLSLEFCQVRHNGPTLFIGTHLRIPRMEVASLGKTVKLYS